MVLQAPDWGPRGPEAAQDSRPVPEPKTFHTTCLADVEPEEVRWLWYPYIPMGKLTSIEGDPGLGKSWITCALAKAVANGEALPGQKHPLPPQKVLMASAEDGMADTLVPRLRSMGADLSNIYAIDDNFTLTPAGIRNLEETLRKFAAAIVFIDPLVAYLGGKVDMNRANEVREVLSRMALAAERTGAAIVTVRHLRKASSSKSIYRGLGSIDFTAASRSVLFVEQGKSGAKLVRHVKCNYAAKGRAIEYELAPGEEIEGTNKWTMGTFNWVGFFGGDFDEEDEPRVSAVEEAQIFLFDLLREGRMPALAVKDAAIKRKIGESALQRAKKGVAISRKDGDQWYWMLKDGEGTVAEEPAAV